MHVINLKEGSFENVSYPVNKPEGFEDVFQSATVTNYLSPEVTSMSDSQHKSIDQVSPKNNQTSLSMSCRENQVEAVDAITPIAR